MRHPRLHSATLGLVAMATVVGCGHDQHPNVASAEMQQMQIGDAPPAVRAAVQRDYPMAKVNYIAKHELGDHTHYHVELTTQDGKTVYRTYSPTGQDMSDPH